MYCPLKGGALKRTSNILWAHIECHLLVHGSSPLSNLQFSTDFSSNTKVFLRFILPNVFFKNLNICILQCVVCNLTSGKCFRCSEGDCESWFHISCAIFSGFEFQIDRPTRHKFIIHCSNHCYVREKVNSKRKKKYIIFLYYYKYL